MRTIYLEPNTPRVLGRRGEDNSVCVRVDVNAWHTDYPTGNGALLYMNPNRISHPLNTTLTQIEGKYYLEATITDYELQYAGWAVITAAWYDGTTMVYSRGYGVKVLMNDAPELFPEKTCPDWVSEIIESLSNAQTVIEDAEEIIDTIVPAADSVLAAEAWAAGTRDGEPVESTDDAYHNNAKYYKDEAKTYRDTAMNSADNAVLAMTGANTAMGAAQTAKTAAEAAQTAAEAAQTAAETAQETAEDAAEDAETSATAAASSATSASGSATSASTSATAASGSATAAAGSATSAASSATSAASSATDAATAKTAAEAAQAAAETAQAAAESAAAQAAADVVEDWLEDNVDPSTGYVIDSSLTVTGAAADAKKTGDEISDLKSAFNVIDDTLGQTRIEPENVTDNYALLTTGYAKYDTDCCALKYPVTAGETILIKSPAPSKSTYASFQFQSAIGISELNNNNLVGEPYTEQTYAYIVVPSGAAYVIISALKTDTESGLYKYDAFDDVDNKINDLRDDIKKTEENVKQCYIQKTATGNPVTLTDSATASLISLTADADCTVEITGKNLLSADFEKVTWADRDEETIIYGKGGYDYNFPGRVTVAKCENNTITLTPTSANVITTGVGIFVKVKPNTTYVLSYDVSGAGTASVMRYDSTKAYISNVKESAASGYSFTTGDTTEYVCISFRGTSQNNAVTFTNMQLEEGNTATAFTPYHEKQTVPVLNGTETNVENVFSYYPVTHIIGTNNATLTVGYYANVGSVLEQGNKTLIEDIQKNSFVSSYNTLDGWEEHAKAFSQLMYDTGNTEGFMFFTDTHFMAKQTESAWKEYAYVIFAYMEQLYYASPCSFVLHGGDWLGSSEAWNSIIYKLSTLGGIFRSRFDRFALLVGNHETGNQSEGNHTTTHGTLAATLLSNVGKTYYRFDANTFHLYCFDSWVSGAIDSYAKEQIKWFGHCLENETVEHIAIAIHILYDSGALKPIGDELTKMASAYNSGSAAYEYDGETFDFSSRTGKVAFVIAGHEHGDATGTVNGIPYIMTVNTTGYSETNFSNLPLPLDLIKVDWDTAKLTAYRAARGAAGTTRELTIIV